MAEKKTEMVLKVDLHCPCCYKKVKKILCKYPEIRDQRFDEKDNTVSIIVVTCCPEKIRDKLSYKGGKVIKSIEIKEPPKPKPEKPKDQEKPKVHGKPKDQDKPKDVPKEASKSKGQEKPKESGKPKDHEKPKDHDKNKSAPEKSAEHKAHPPTLAPSPMLHPMPGPMMPPMAGPMLQPMPGMVAAQAAQGFPPPVETGYVFMPNYGESYHNGPYNHGYGMPVVAAPPSFDYYGQNYGGYGKPSYVHRDEYFSEENAQGCSIM